MSTSEVTSSSKIQTDYMKLLVTQLQNQNPLEPMDNNQMAAQLTQFSQLQQLESMSSSFAEVLETIERNYATSLIGKEVSFVGEIQPGVNDIISGTVEQIYNNVDGEIVLSVGSYTLNLENIISVKN
ncbi:MAG: flagellar hook assembly protein FlgD [Planctomycetota bacterium]|jgi:flagellar basal-body rod modification protein FlgD